MTSEDFIAKMEKINKRLYNSLSSFLASISDGDTLQFKDELAIVEAKIREALRGAKYVAVVDEYLKEFVEIDKELISTYKDVPVEDIILRSESKKFIIENTIQSLKGSGVNEVFVRKIANIIRQDAITGISLKDAMKRLNEAIIEKPELTRYVRQVATDALFQYDGALNEDIKKEFGFTKFRYLGSLVEDSRPFCEHMKSLGSVIDIEQLKIALDDFCPNGEPKKGKGDGMIKGTTVANFSINRGGYNCGHRVRWVS